MHHELTVAHSNHQPRCVLPSTPANPATTDPPTAAPPLQPAPLEHSITGPPPVRARGLTPPTVQCVPALPLRLPGRGLRAGREGHWRCRIALPAAAHEKTGRASTTRRGAGQRRCNRGTWSIKAASGRLQHVLVSLCRIRCTGANHLQHQLLLFCRRVQARKSPIQYYTDMVKHAVLVKIPGKGRELLATSDLPPCTVVVINPALVCATDDGRGQLVFCRDDKFMTDAAGAALRSKAVQAASDQPLVAHTMRCPDEKNPFAPHSRVLPLAALPEMQQRISARVLPLLPSSNDYLPVAERVEVAAPFVDRLCTVNYHGHSHRIGTNCHDHNTYHCSLLAVGA
eukprot:jgi/Ulvmu1/7648/UM038_0077.1